jgi:alpha-galactosidase
MLDYCRIIEEVAPGALLLNYTNPMGMLTGAILKATGVHTVGLCHSVQGCASHLCWELGLPNDNLKWKIAGINHQGWLLEISRDGEDLYPEIKRRAVLPDYVYKDTVRFELMKRFGYYVTESSEHSSEYVPWFIKSTHPELIDEFHVPLDEYPRRCVDQIKGWEGLKEYLLSDQPLAHDRGEEYASYIFEAVLTGRPYTFGGNVLNKNLITNLPYDSCVEVMCVADRNGVTPTHVGALPVQCAALTRTNVNVQELAIEAALTRKRDHIYHAALLDPHTAAELSIDQTVAMCDELIEAHGDYLPKYC